MGKKSKFFEKIKEKAIFFEKNRIFSECLWTLLNMSTSFLVSGRFLTRPTAFLATLTILNTHALFFQILSLLLRILISFFVGKGFRTQKSG